MALVSGMSHLNRLTTRLQPFAHELHFVLLAGLDAVGGLYDGIVIGPRGNQFGHVYRLLVVDDHALHEGDICRRISCIRQRDGFRLVDHSRCLSGCAGHHDGDCLRQRR